MLITSPSSQARPSPSCGINRRTEVRRRPVQSVRLLWEYGFLPTPQCLPVKPALPDRPPVHGPAADPGGSDLACWPALASSEHRNPQGRGPRCCRRQRSGELGRSSKFFSAGRWAERRDSSGIATPSTVQAASMFAAGFDSVRHGRNEAICGVQTNLRPPDAGERGYRRVPGRDGGLPSARHRYFRHPVSCRSCRACQADGLSPDLQVLS